MQKTSVKEFYKVFGQKEVWKILSRDVKTTMNDQVDTKETKHSPWFKTSKIKFWTCLQKKKKRSLTMPTISSNKYLICFYNINSIPVEPNWMIRIPSACNICKSEISLEEGMANEITVARFHFALWYKCLDWMISKLGLSPPAYYIECTMHHESIRTCHFRIPPSWVRRDHSSRKSS